MRMNATDLLVYTGIPFRGTLIKYFQLALKIIKISILGKIFTVQMLIYF